MNNKICFITCVNHERYYEEALVYLKRLAIPENFTAEYIAMRNGKSMASAYNQAMRQSDAKYKVYLHQDALMINRDCINEVIALFQQNEQIGCIGLAGAKYLQGDIWWREEKICGRIIHSGTDESIHENIYGEVKDDFAFAQAVDGVFLATQYDFAWREDLFDGWHFYDISQCMEFGKQGYKVAVPRQKKAWCIHYSGDKPLDDNFKKYCNIFHQAYKKAPVKPV